MTAATSLELSWEALIAVIVIVLALTLLGIVPMTRSLREHHLRVGFFLERGDQHSEDEPPPEEEMPS